jgi:hypothetical protein
VGLVDFRWQLGRGLSKISWGKLRPADGLSLIRQPQFGAPGLSLIRQPQFGAPGLSLIRQPQFGTAGLSLIRQPQFGAAGLSLIRPHSGEQLSWYSNRLRSS